MSLSRVYGYSLAFFLAALIGFGPAPLRAQVPAQITPQDCAVCHEDVVKAFGKNPHETLALAPRNLVNPCESCHGPGREHIESGGEPSKIIAFKGERAEFFNKQCLNCHRDNRHVNAFLESRHAREGLDCTSCHKIHFAAVTTPLLKERTNGLCMSCHDLQRTQFSKPFHHPVREEGMTCADCHNPHSGIDHNMVKTSFSGEEVCYRCHSEIQGPYVFEHEAIMIRGCTGCHQPHGSNNTRMLVRSTVSALCLECHSRSQNVLTAQPPSFHNLNSPIFQNCTTCHVMIHGSNFSRIFLR